MPTEVPVDDDYRARQRAQAIQELLDAKPMPVDDWPVMKRQMLEDRYAGVMKYCVD
jgi:hypothetical protein